MKTELITSRIARIFAEHLGLLETEVQPDKAIVGDLGADSLDGVELVMAVEDEFEIEIDDAEAEAWVTVADVIKTIERLTADRE